jgi:hypothetical protein
MNEEKKNFLKKKIAKQFLIVALVSAVVLLIFLLRPVKDLSKPMESNISDKKTVIDELGDINSLKPMESPVKGEKLSDVPLQRDFVTKKVKDLSQKGDEKGVAGEKDLWSTRKLESNGRMSNDFSQHQGMAVKSKDKIETNKDVISKYPLVDPDLSKPHPINFKGLKKVYAYFRLKDTFPQVVLEKLNGAAVEMTGAVMPVDTIPEDGLFRAFWLSNPVIVLAGCVFCNPPTLADIIYVYKDGAEKPFKFEREKLFKQVVLVKVKGRLFFGPETIKDQTFLFSIIADSVEVLN